MNMLEKILKAKEDLNNRGKNGSTDNRFWKPDGYGTFNVRFLPAKNSDNLFFAQFGEHWVRGADGKAHRFLCPRVSKKSKCPICEAAFELYENDEKAAGRELLPRTYWYANVIVRNEEGDFGPKILKFGKQLFEAIVDECENLEVDISDPENGYDFKILKKKVKTGEQVYPNYSRSRADTATGPTPLTDEELEMLEKAEDIHEMIEREILSYRNLKEKFLEVLSGDDDEEDDDEPAFERKSPVVESSDDDDEDEVFDEDDFLRKVNEQCLDDE